VSKQPAFLGRPERRSATELERPPGVVEDRRGEEQVAAEACVHLRGFAAERCDGDGVLEQAAGVDVVRFRARRQFAKPRAKPFV